MPDRGIRDTEAALQADAQAVAQAQADAQASQTRSRHIASTQASRFYDSLIFGVHSLDADSSEF
jgi:hypothetical protein